MTVHPEPSSSQVVDAIVRRALDEDIGTGDVTSIATIDALLQVSGRFLAKENGVLSGTRPATRVFELVDPAVAINWSLDDGDPVTSGGTIGHVSGSARSILTAERTALNILQRMSGIASLTSLMAAAAAPYGTRMLDTRKTAPGLRILDKMAVAHGGGANHRFGLYDMILIKDNHIASSGSIHQALADAEAYRSRSGGAELSIEIEARSLKEVEEVMAYWASNGVPDRILLDNMTKRRSDGRFDTELLREAVDIVSGRVETEASGNVELATVAAIAATGVDYISSGALTHSVRALDISLEFSLGHAAGP